MNKDQTTSILGLVTGKQTGVVYMYLELFRTNNHGYLGQYYHGCDKGTNKKTV